MRERTVRCHEAHDNEFLILPRSPDKSFILLETLRCERQRDARAKTLFIRVSDVGAWLDSLSFVPYVEW